MQQLIREEHILAQLATRVWPDGCFAHHQRTCLTAVLRLAPLLLLLVIEPFFVTFSGTQLVAKACNTSSIACVVRVQITYDVETGGAQDKELPFVVGVLADLSGQPKDAPKALKERKFVPIDRDNFNDVLEKSKPPRVALQVPNRLSEEKDTMLNVELDLEALDDFEPAAVAKQVPALKQLLDMRDQLDQLLGKMEGNDKLAELLGDILNDSDHAKELAGELVRPTSRREVSNPSRGA